MEIADQESSRIEQSTISLVYNSWEQQQRRAPSYLYVCVIDSLADTIKFCSWCVMW